MKQLFVFIAVCWPVMVNAAEPSISCPSGYIAITEEFMTIADNSCPSGATSVGTADSCLVAPPVGSCIMYAPANTEYTDESGVYEYIAACAME